MKLSKIEYHKVLKIASDDIKKIPFKDWIDKLNSLLVNLKLEEIESTDAYMNDIINKHGNLPKNFPLNLLDGNDPFYKFFI
jgi:hypothetical protein